MTIKFVNFFKSKIADVGGIGSGDTEATLSAGDGAKLPTLTGGHHCYLTFVDVSSNREIVKVTGVASDTITIVRGQDGTTPRAFSENDLVELRLTRGSLEDIQGDIGVIEDIIEAFTNGVVGTDPPANFKVDVLATYPVVTSGFNDGIQNISFPTNGMAAAKFMLGNSDTILWMYLNTAPPGWKVLATGADTVLGVVGGAQAYNVNGGNPGGTWTQPSHVHTGPSHTHIGPSHTHIGGAHTHDVEFDGWSATGAAGANSKLAVHAADASLGSVYRASADRSAGAKSGGAVATLADGAVATLAGGTDDTGGSATASTYRPAASVGKLFQLDTP